MDWFLLKVTCIEFSEKPFLLMANSVKWTETDTHSLHINTKLRFVFRIRKTYHFFIRI